MTVERPNLLEGKTHISYSELSTFSQCAHKWKLQYVDKHRGPSSPYLIFGTGCHTALENYLKTREIVPEIAIKYFEEEWDKNKEVESFVKLEPKRGEFVKHISEVLLGVPEFFAATFPDWEYVSAEEALYEQISPEYAQKFKGFIDCTIKAKVGKRQVEKIWILDFKTTGPMGWSMEQKMDNLKKSQIVLYKKFWADKHGVDMSDIKCGFILMKRGVKTARKHELFEVSAGETTVKRSLTLIDNMFRSIEKGFVFKNRNSCEWCDFKNTPLCP